MITHLAHQEHRSSWLFSQRQVQLVAAHGLFQGRSHLVRDTKKPVRWHHAVDALVGPEVVVVGDEMAEPFLGFREVLGLHAVPKLFTHRGPKPFGLSHGLWVVSSRHHVLDALPYQQFLEIPFAPPGEILAALVGQHFLGLSETLDPVQQGLNDDVLFLVQVQSP